jgi:hypothetical protein
MIEVFKTNVRSRALAKSISKILTQKFPQYTVSFDLQDCDRILRIASEIHIDAVAVQAELLQLGVEAEVLSDDVPVQ